MHRNTDSLQVILQVVLNENAAGLFGDHAKAAPAR